MAIYKAYDIRGIYRQEWNEEEAYKIGFCLPSLLNAGKILVGRDARESSDEIFSALGRGIVDSGCDVWDIGLSSTPALYFATAHYDMDGSVMITASHNPPEYNGLKISGRNAVPVGYDNGLDKLEKMVRGDPGGAGRGGNRGKIHRLDIREDYLRHLEPYKTGIDGVKAVIDCSDGMGGVFIQDILSDIPGRIDTMYDRPDGRFPHHDPNPLIEANLQDLKDRTLSDGADMGICYDGDADRVMFIDEKGKFVSPDLITALLGIYFGDRIRGRAVSYDVRSSRSVVEFIEKLGGKPVICPVGHSYAKRLLRETGGLYGGELAGHYYFGDNYFCDSGDIAALIVLGVLSSAGQPLSALMSRIDHYHFSGEINFKVEDKDRIIREVGEAFHDGRLTDIDGIRIDYPTWWFSLRKSNTEPYLRLVVEAETAGELELRREELTKRIEYGV